MHTKIALQENKIISMFNSVKQFLKGIYESFIVSMEIVSYQRIIRDCSSHLTEEQVNDIKKRLLELKK
jgi:hypothetical protein